MYTMIRKGILFGLLAAIGTTTIIGALVWLERTAPGAFDALSITVLTALVGMMLPFRFITLDLLTTPMEQGEFEEQLNNRSVIYIAVGVAIAVPLLIFAGNFGYSLALLVGWVMGTPLGRMFVTSEYNTERAKRSSV